MVELLRSLENDLNYGLQKEINILPKLKSYWKDEPNIRNTKAWRYADPRRNSAHLKLRRAVKSGVIKPHPCWVCGEKAEAHHPDYSAPLDVVWLCTLHHRRLHLGK